MADTSSGGGGRTWLDACTVPCGKVAGIPVRLHLLFPIVLALGLVGQIGRPWQNFVWAAVVYGPLLLGTVLVHELGHCYATRRLGAPVHGILLWPLGGLAFVGHTATPRDDLLVAAAGPATHIPQVGFWLILEVVTTAIIARRPFLAWWWPPSNNVWLAIVCAAVALNVTLCAFNLLLPVYPLDGGRVLADALLMCGVPVRTAAFAVGGIGAALGVAIIVYGFMRGLGGILVVAIGVWALFSTAEIVAAAVRGDAAAHPLFNFGGNGGGGGGGGQQQQQAAAPAWPPQAAPPPGGANPFAASRV